MASVLLIGMQTAFASHPEVSLPGSNFEIDTDANLKVDDPAPSIDWASVSETRKADLASGSGDDSFGQGTKEDTRNPTIVDGSIPPNKSDLLNFGVYLEEIGNQSFLNLFWHRVQEPSGTTNMDFEFNQSDEVAGNGVTPVRTAGDILIQYDLAQGGTTPELFLSRWVASGPASQCEAKNSTPCWGTKTNLTAAGNATGSINTSAIPAAQSDGLGDISPRTFGEAQIDFDALTGADECAGFGSAYLKSRSSDSFTAALKDFIAPTPVNFDRCGAIEITKTAKHKDTSGNTSPNLVAGFTIKKGGTQVGDEVFTDANGKACVDDLQQGSDYTVEESTPPSGYAKDTSVESVNVDTVATCDDNPFVGEKVSFENTPLTDLSVSVNSQVNGGTASTVSCTPDGPSGSTGANGDGTFSDTNLAPGTYTCTVVIDP